MLHKYNVLHTALISRVTKLFFLAAKPPSLFVIMSRKFDLSTSSFGYQYQTSQYLDRLQMMTLGSGLLPWGIKLAFVWVRLLSFASPAHIHLAFGEAGSAPVVDEFRGSLLPFSQVTCCSFSGSCLNCLRGNGSDYRILRQHAQYTILDSLLRLSVLTAGSHVSF